MTLLFSDETDIKLNFDMKEIAKKVICAVIKEENCPNDIEVSLSLVQSEKTHELNREFRHIDRTTDVLSFPMFSYEKPGDFTFLKGQKEEDEEIILGDIVLNLDKVISQAEEYGHSKLREFSFLIAHSMLHLMGYDHIEAEERKIMEHKQNIILEGIGITRDLED